MMDPSIGPLILMVNDMIKDVTRWLVIQLVFLIGFTSALYALAGDPLMTTTGIYNEGVPRATTMSCIEMEPCTLHLTRPRVGCALSRVLPIATDAHAHAHVLLAGACYGTVQTTRARFCKWATTRRRTEPFGRGCASSSC